MRITAVVSVAHKQLSWPGVRSTIGKVVDSRRTTSPA